MTTIINKIIWLQSFQALVLDLVCVLNSSTNRIYTKYDSPQNLNILVLVFHIWVLLTNILSSRKNRATGPTDLTSQKDSKLSWEGWIRVETYSWRTCSQIWTNERSCSGVQPMKYVTRHLKFEDDLKSLIRDWTYDNGVLKQNQCKAHRESLIATMGSNHGSRGYHPQ